MQGSTDLVEHTRQLLINRPRSVTMRVIVENTRCSERWLSLLVAGGGKQYSAQKVQSLYEYLSGRPLIKGDHV